MKFKLSLLLLIVLFPLLLLAQDKAQNNAQELYNKNEVVDQGALLNAPAVDKSKRTHNITAVLYDNGPLVTNPGAGAGGADESMLQTTSLGMNTLGFGHQVLNDNHIADDFTVTGGSWNVDYVYFYAYQTGSTTTSTMTAVYYQIWDGDPNVPGSSVIWGDLVTNQLNSTGWSNIYRTTETSVGSTARPIMEQQCNAGFVLPTGTYWIEWMTDGTLGSGPWAPPITILGNATTGNAQQSIAGTWGPAQDSGTLTPQGFPFVLEGTIGSAIADVTFICDMTSMFHAGLFEPAKVNNVFVRGSFNGWGSDAMIPIPSTVGEVKYEFTLTNIPVDTELEYKFFYDNPNTWESIHRSEPGLAENGNRYYKVGDPVKDLNDVEVNYLGGLYTPGTTMDLDFELYFTTTSVEWGDLFEMTFPIGVTPTAASDPLDGSPLNPIVGQTVSWGDDDNSFGDILPNSYWPFTITVDIDPAKFSGPMDIDWHLSGDLWGGVPPNDIYGQVTVGQVVTNITLMHYFNNFSNYIDVDFTVDMIFEQEYGFDPDIHTVQVHPFVNGSWEYETMDPVAKFDEDKYAFSMENVGVHNGGVFPYKYLYTEDFSPATNVWEEHIEPTPDNPFADRWYYVTGQDIMDGAMVFDQTWEDFVPPVAGIDDSDLEDMLNIDQQSAHLKTLTNDGDGDLNYEVVIDLDAKGNWKVVSPHRDIQPAVADGRTALANGATALRAPLTFDAKATNNTAAGLDLAIVSSTLPGSNDFSEIIAALLALGVNSVDVIDIESSLPALGDLLMYDGLLFAFNTFFTTATEPAGDLLADYVDGGGKLILSVPVFITGFAGTPIGGRLLDDGYFPVVPGPGPVGPGTLGAFDPGHPIMDGVTTCGGDLLADVTLDPGAELVASWDFGAPLVAVKGSVVAINAFFGAPGWWTGDMDLIVFNTFNFLQGGGGWFSVNSTSGTVPGHSSFPLTFTMNSNGLDNGIYSAKVDCMMNDPYNKLVSFEATLFVGAEVYGMVTYTNGNAVPGLDVTFTNTTKDHHQFLTTTNDYGEFYVPVMPPAVYSAALTGGYDVYDDVVNIQDIVLAHNMAQNIAPKPELNTLPFWAADVSMNNMIGTEDALMIQDYVFGGLMDLLPGGEWLTYPGALDLTVANEAMIYADPIMTQMPGDVNQSYGFEWPFPGSVTINPEDQILPVDKSIVAPVYMGENSNLGAFVLNLAYDDENFEVESFSSKLPNAKYTENDGSLFVTGFMLDKSVKLTKGDELFSFTFKKTNDEEVDFFALELVDAKGALALNKDGDNIDLTLSTVQFGEALPTTYDLSQNYPNPFNPTTKIKFSLPQADVVTLKIYDILGAEVRTLVNGKMEAGRYELEIDAGNLPSGAYIYRIVTNNYTATKKMMLLK